MLYDKLMSRMKENKVKMDNTIAIAIESTIAKKIDSFDDVDFPVNLVLYGESSWNIGDVRRVLEKEGFKNVEVRYSFREGDYRSSNPADSHLYSVTIKANPPYRP